MRHSMRKKVLLAAGATLIILGSAGWLVYRNASQTANMVDGADHTPPNLAAAAERTMAVLDLSNLLTLLLVTWAVIGVRRDYVLWEQSEAAATEARRRAEREAAERLMQLKAADAALTAYAEKHEQIQHRCCQLEQLGVVGRLTSGVAHDFNNLLTVMMGCCEATLYSLPSDDPLREALGTALQAGETAVGLTRQLTSVARKRPVLLARVDLNIVATEMIGMLRRLAPGVELELALDPLVRPIMADRAKFEQVLLNLVVNARDASPLGGRVQIVTRWAGTEVQLAVIDDGCGMDEATQARLFEPFFTTKEVGKGTGLGMAVVSEAVRESGGRIEVCSIPGRGTAVRVYLPATDEGGARPATVLLVDPVGRTADLIQETLGKFGHTVLRARDDNEALEKARAYPGAIHLLITNGTPPGIGGPDLAAQLRAARPDMKVLFLVEDSAAASVRLDQAAVLPRPFGMDAVGRKLREVLGR